MYRIKNTADDRSKEALHRVANKFEIEPSLGGHRIRLRTHLDITDEHYRRVKHMVDAWVSKGIVDVIKLDEDRSASQEDPMIFPEVVEEAPPIILAPPPGLVIPQDIEVTDPVPVPEVTTAPEPSTVVESPVAVSVPMPLPPTPPSAPALKKKLR